MPSVKVPNEERFLGKVDAYVLGRPSYAKALVSFAESHFKLAPSARIADLGAGTGILSRIFIEAGYEVTGVEPNPEMRAAALNEVPTSTFRVLDGFAEKTGLPDASIDLVMAGQAFHWFEPEKCRVECDRILKPPGNILFVWNKRNEWEGFGGEYEALLKEFGEGYRDGRHRQAAESVTQFAQPFAVSVHTFPNEHAVNWEQMWARINSTSYVPTPDRPRYPKMREAFLKLFERYESGGKVVFKYLTHAYATQIKSKD